MCLGSVLPQPAHTHYRTLHPALPVCLSACSLAALPQTEYWKIGVYFGAVLAVYLLFSLPMSYIKHSQIDYVNTEELK